MTEAARSMHCERSSTRLATVGDPIALGECLSLLHHALLTPRYARERLPIADELMAVAARTGDRTLSIMGLLWRTVDLFLLGHVEAERSLADLRLRAEQFDMLLARDVVAAIDTMLLMRAGRFGEAEAAAAECHRLGTEVGDADADPWYLAQLFAIRWMQGRGGEFLPVRRATWRADTTLVHANAGYLWTVEAVLAAEAGAHEQARRALDRVLAHDLESLPETSAWLPALFGVAEAAAILGDTTAAHEAARRLEEYASLPIMGSLAIVCFGSAARALGLARRTLGDSTVPSTRSSARSCTTGGSRTSRCSRSPAPISPRRCINVEPTTIARAPMSCSATRSRTARRSGSTPVSRGGEPARRSRPNLPDRGRSSGASPIGKSRCSRSSRRA